jgi:exodeoxyribonuclease-1
MRDRPVQFAGVRTDEALNIIGEPLMLFAKPADDYLPHPDACMITGITPQQAMREGVCEAEFIRRIHAELAQPGTCGVGYNSIRFDDEVTRYTLYRNFFDPYTREWQNGNSRWDIIDMLRLARSLRPEGIEWPNYEDGRPSMKLEHLTEANGIEHSAAHDALSDVYATIALARLVRERQPKLYDYVLKMRDKRRVAEMLDVISHKPVLHVSSKYPAEYGNLAVVAPLVQHPTNKNGVIVYDLREDPSTLIELDVEAIRERLFTPASELPKGERRIPLKVIHTNKCPVLAPASMLNPEEAERWQIRGGDCRNHLAMLREAEGLVLKVQQVFASPGFEPRTDPDLMLYSGGFFGPGDKRAMDSIRATKPDKLGLLELAFQDGRLEEMLFRYRARNYSETLNEDEQERWEQYRHQRLISPETGQLGFDDFYTRLNELALEPGITEAKRHLLEELAAYGESIYPIQV